MKRYLQLDFLRGACLLIMTIDHFGELSLVELFGFISAAEGFVFISGIVAGIVYYRRRQKESFSGLRKSAFHRAITLYKYHIICLATLVLILLSGLTIYQEFYTRAGLFSENLLLASVLNATFLYKIYHLDILPIYVIFLLLLPLAIKHADSKNGGILLLCSALLWLVNLFGVTDNFYLYLNSFIKASPGNFQVLSWQFLFFIGFALGVLEVKGKLDVLKRNRLLFGMGVLLVAVFFVLNLTHFTSLIPAGAEEMLISKTKIGVMRLVNFLSVALVITYLLYRFQNLGKNGIMRMLGRHSLYVFTFQTVFLFVVIPFYLEYYVHGILVDYFDSKVIRKGITLITTIPLSLVIFIPAYIRERRNKHVKRRV